MKPTPIKRPASPSRPPMVVREHSPALRPDSALAQLVRETRESGVEVLAWSIRGGQVR